MPLQQAVVWYKDRDGSIKGVTVLKVERTGDFTCNVQVDLDDTQLERQREKVIYHWCQMNGIHFPEGDPPGEAIKNHILMQGGVIVQQSVELTRLRASWGVRLQNFLTTFVRMFAISLHKKGS